MKNLEEMGNHMFEETKPRIVKSHDINLDSDYINWIHDVKQRYISTQIKAAVKVNTERLYFNWQLGRDLVERKAEEKWGKGIVEQLSLDLQNEFPDAAGFSARNLWNMKKWYLFYSSSDTFLELAHTIENNLDLNSLKLQQVGAKISENQKTAPSWCRNRISCNLRICTMETSCGNSNKM